MLTECLSGTAAQKECVVAFRGELRNSSKLVRFAWQMGSLPQQRAAEYRGPELIQAAVELINRALASVLPRTA